LKQAECMIASHPFRVKQDGLNPHLVEVCHNSVGMLVLWIGYDENVSGCHERWNGSGML